MRDPSRKWQNGIVPYQISQKAGRFNVFSKTIFVQKRNIYTLWADQLRLNNLPKLSFLNGLYSLQAQTHTNTHTHGREKP